MKRIVSILVFPIALLLGHLLFYSAGCDFQNAQTLLVCEYDFETVISDIHCTDTPFFKDGEETSDSKNEESVESLTSITFVKKAQTDTTPDSVVGILKSGKLLNSNTLYDYQVTLSYHTSGVRATEDRLFTLESIRC